MECFPVNNAARIYVTRQNVALATNEITKSVYLPQSDGNYSINNLNVLLVIINLLVFMVLICGGAVLHAKVSDDLEMC